MKQFNSATDSAFKFMLLNALVVAPSHSRCSSMFSLPNYSLLAQFSFAGYMISFNPECRGSCESSIELLIFRAAFYAHIFCFFYNEKASPGSLLQQTQLL
jgi:hypothetical protein